MRKLSLVLFWLALWQVVTFAAVQEDLVTEDLPGCGHFDFKSYSGYIPVGDKFKFHYYFAESMNKPETDPLIIWFTGGPGCSGMLAAFLENGPCVFEALSSKSEPHLNPYPWNAKANVLYVDSPAGVGFNLGYEGEYIDDEVAGHQAVNLTLGFFKRFPEYLQNELFITGESYAGIYVPYLAYYLHTGGHTTKSGGKLNLQGIAVGNGVTEYKYDCFPAYVKMSFQHGLIPGDLQKRIVDSGCDFSQTSYSQTPQLSYECNSLFNEWYAHTTKINVYDIYRSPKDGGLNSKNSIKNFLTGEHESILSETLGFTNFDTHYQDQRQLGLQVPQYMDRDDVRRILHVQAHTDKFQACVRFNYHKLAKASVWIYPHLKEYGYRILKYSGDTDGAVPYLGTQAWIEELGWPLKINHQPFEMNGKVAGFYTEREGLEFVIFHGVGHLVPAWMREESQFVLYKFINGQKPI